MAQRTFLHVGPPKTGTTYLQSGWRQQRQRLAAAGLLYPGSDPADQFRACVVALDHQVFVPRMDAHRAGTWDRFRAEIDGHDGDALLSSEFYARAEPETAARIVRQLKEVSDEVHVLINARDLGRQVLAAWQQYVKRCGTRTLQSFWDRHNADDATAWKFWRNQDIPALAQRWLDAGADAVTLVVVGAPDAGHDQVWRDMCDILDLEHEPLPVPRRSNRSLGAVEVEVLRRINRCLPPGSDRVRSPNLTSKLYSDRVAELGLPKVPVAVSSQLAEEVRARAGDQVQRLTAMVNDGRVQVVGELKHLEARIEPVDSQVDEALVAEALVAEASTRMLASMVPDQLRIHDRDRELRAEIRRLRAELRIGASLRRVARRLTRRDDRPGQVPDRTRPVPELPDDASPEISGS